MTSPVLVRAYTAIKPAASPQTRNRRASKPALPKPASWTFVNIFKAVDSPELQEDIDGIAKICAKSRMSLADEYAAHIAPQGEITTTKAEAVQPRLLRSGTRRPLTSVPEASSGSSEGSRKSREKRASLFSFKRRRPDGQKEASNSVRTIRIGTMGRSVSVGGIAALTVDVDPFETSASVSVPSRDSGRSLQTIARPQRRTSEAAESLRHLLATSRPIQTS